jgi:hypothetical protein
LSANEFEIGWKKLRRLETGRATHFVENNSTENQNTKTNYENQLSQIDGSFTGGDGDFVRAKFIRAIEGKNRRGRFHAEQSVVRRARRDGEGARD